MSLTAHSLAQLKRLGYSARVVERWNPFAKVRRDLFGIGDVLAMRANEPLLLI